MFLQAAVLQVVNADNSLRVLCIHQNMNGFLFNLLLESSVIIVSASIFT